MQKTIRIKMWITFYFCGKEHLFVDKYPHFLWFSFAKASKLSTIYQKMPSYPQENKKYKNSKNEKVDKLSTEKRCFFVVRRLNPFKMKKIDCVDLKSYPQKQKMNGGQPSFIHNLVDK